MGQQHSSRLEPAERQIHFAFAFHSGRRHRPPPRRGFPAAKQTNQRQVPPARKWARCLNWLRGELKFRKFQTQPSRQDDDTDTASRRLSRLKRRLTTAQPGLRFNLLTPLD